MLHKGGIDLKRVAIYLRCGTDAEYHTTEKVLAALIAEHSDWQLVKKYADNGYNGNDTKRPALNEMITACENGEIDLVLIDGIKHLSRNTQYLIELVERLKNADAEIYDNSSSGLINLDDPIADSLLEIVRIGGRERKADTPKRETNRRYEERNKEKRKAASGTFSTYLPRNELDEIVAFLKKYGITKVDLIRQGYLSLQNTIKESQERSSK